MTSSSLAIIRENEQIKAGEILKISNITFLRNEDGELDGINPLDLKKNITLWIRTYEPDLLLTFSPETDYKMYSLGLMHSDHQTTGRRSLDSAYPACRDYLNFPELYDNSIMPWNVPEVWLFSFQTKLNNNEYLIKLSDDMFNLKYQALLQHESQYDDPVILKQGI
jgi:LmbE family N-acetylglucosaminyl deacetylase